MVAAVLASRPGGRLAARGPLAGHPPPPDLAGVGRVGEVEDHHDVAVVALDLRGDVRVASVPVEAVHAGTAGLPECDLAGPVGPGDVPNGEAAAEPGRRVERRRRLPIDQHDPVGDADLVRLGGGRHAQLSQPPGMLGIADVHDRGALRPAEVADVGDAAVHEYLAAARTVEVRNLPQPSGNVHTANSRNLACRANLDYHQPSRRAWGIPVEMHLCGARLTERLSDGVSVTEIPTILRPIARLLIRRVSCGRKK